MDKSRKIRLLIVDDHPVVRMGLHLVQDLNPALKVVGEAATGAEAVAQAEKLKPDVVLLDYRLPDFGGHDVCRRIKSVSPATRVLFLSSYAMDTTAAAALDSGADGYLLKENDAQKIVDAIQVVCQGGMVIDPAIARAAVTRVRSGPESPEDPLARLTEQERHVLAALATGKTDKEIASTLNLQPKTVRNYLAQVYRKLEVRTRTEAALLYERSGRSAAQTDAR